MLIMALFVTYSCRHVGWAEDKEPPVVKTEKASPELNIPYAHILKWQILYYEERMRAIALEYTGLCFKDKRYIKATNELKRLRRIKETLNNSKEGE